MLSIILILAILFTVGEAQLILTPPSNLFVHNVPASTSHARGSLHNVPAHLDVTSHARGFVHNVPAHLDVTSHARGFVHNVPASLRKLIPDGKRSGKRIEFIQQADTKMIKFMQKNPEMVDKSDPRWFKAQAFGGSTEEPSDMMQAKAFGGSTEEPSDMMQAKAFGGSTEEPSILIDFTSPKLSQGDSAEKAKEIDAKSNKIIYCSPFFTAETCVELGYTECAAYPVGQLLFGYCV